MIVFTHSHTKMLETNSPEFSKATTQKVPWSGEACYTHPFLWKGFKTSGTVYRNILHEVVEPLNETLFDGEHWVFRQDSATGHGTRATQDWLERNVPNFISKEEWPSESLDLNPLDYKIWWGWNRWLAKKHIRMIRSIFNLLREGSYNELLKIDDRKHSP